MEQKTVNDTKQILMNELGLTREWVRGIATDVVEQTIQRQLEAGHLEKHVQLAVRTEIGKLLVKPYGNTESALGVIVRDAIAAEVKSLVQNHIKIEVTARV